MNKLLSISEMAKRLGVSTSTLRRWERLYYLIPARTAGGHRRYDPSIIHDPQFISSTKAFFPEPASNPKKTIVYARVSSHDQKSDLETQKLVLQEHCRTKGYAFETITDLGSGMNYSKKGLKKLLDLILDKKISRIVITHKDRLLRFGAELVISLCLRQNIEVEILNQNIGSSFEEDLAKDVLEIITVFSAKLYGSRARKNQKRLKEMAKEGPRLDASCTQDKTQSQQHSENLLC